MKILRRIYDPICEAGQCRKRHNRESEELYSEPNMVNVIKCSRLKWAGHVERMDENELPKKMLWTTLEAEDVADRNQDGLTGAEEAARKMGCRNWIEVAGDNCLKRSRPTQGCTADDDDDDDDD